LSIIGNWIRNKIPLFFATLLQKTPFRHYVAKGANPQNACILPILEIIGKCYCLINSPLLCHIVARIMIDYCYIKLLYKFFCNNVAKKRGIYKVILYNSNLSLFLQNVATAGLQKHGGVRGERQFSPKSDLFLY
jgi:hypothetical protein